ncbi:N-acetyl-gamma-glutamyl-phosphate reductase [Aurantiacibacter aquimixticola]|uniref:N-acetyl-gamma-glutamyl-phosphate reductase n=1 Tax=Aurantiacibacter aquimixticola TaxID=1958945 RepID=A0A419RTE3_9SPHN|nr:N-acetyl-gamma-glutamyl-phosphate reductase [Aurantiacibacter aquimixticola]RJY09024.1 N-acetyl-gamma-glutamyl-phosphate reductase [Aurantiacibacter aquimixticola]
MAQTVFIDGAEGTTGLEIVDRLEGREEFELIRLSDAERKDAECRRSALNYADFAILCLPDDAAREAMELLDEDGTTRVIDASSAHRTASGWIYGFPELVGTQVIEGAKRVANPGCYPTGFLALVAPLVRAKLLPRDWPFSINAVSGYSGGGKSLISRFDEEGNIAFRSYGTTLGHKHLEEMKAKAGLKYAPVFAPSVVPAYRGMLVDIPLPIAAMRSASSPEKLRAELLDFYADAPVVTVHEDAPDELLLRTDAPASDRLDLYVFGSEDEGSARLIAVFDNLGKGAAGAAVQSLNLMSGSDPLAGLQL